MKKLVLIAAIAALLIAADLRPSTFCFSPDEWCLTGCDNVDAYSIVGFDTMPAAQAFVASLDIIRVETVRVVTFRRGAHHVVVAYRTAVTEPVNTSVTVGVCPPSTVSVYSFSSVDTATIELNRLPAEQRVKAFILQVPAVPRDPNTVALLLVMRTPPDGGVQDPVLAGSSR